jgi:two-component system, chemotaxis family, protein-glutamate methylesterase/glutaminase
VTATAPAPEDGGGNVGTRVRVLVAEDSVTARELLRRVLESDPAIEVVGFAANGAEAVEMTARLQPSIVLMDIDMPVLDGFQATRQIMTRCPTPIIIVTATRRVEDVELSLEAVRHGALALLPKPGWPGSPHTGGSPERLLFQVRALAEVRVVRRMAFSGRPKSPSNGTAPPPADTVVANGVHPAGPTSVEVVGVAASTGGPPALAGLLGGLPADFRAPVLVVQHLPDGFSHGLTSWLNGHSPLPVRLAADDDRLEPATVYVAPEGSHMEIERDRIRLRPGPPVSGFLPAANRLFLSLASRGHQAAAVVLTGMGKDGLDGARTMQQNGGRILAQDRDSSVVFGMPGAVVAAGIADVEGPVEFLAAHLAALTSGGAGP